MAQGHSLFSGGAETGTRSWPPAHVGQWQGPLVAALPGWPHVDTGEVGRKAEGRPPKAHASPSRGLVLQFLSPAPELSFAALRHSQ